MNTGIPSTVTAYPLLFKMDMVVMSIVILCIVSALLYQAVAWLEKRI